jgi:hypothetical protein
MSREFTHVCPWSHDLIGFSIAIKNIHPLEVMPILGSGPSSPTLLKMKLRGKGSTSTAIPFDPVTNIPFGSEISSGIVDDPSSR